LQVGTPFATVQFWLHPPQFARELDVFVSHPSMYCPLQSDHGAVQEATPHIPPEHCGRPFATVQVTLQAPQVRTLFERFDSQPSAYCPLQSWYGPVQLATLQLPPAQPGVPFATVHATLHAPQVATLVSRFASQPSAYCPLQSWYGPVQLATLHALFVHPGVPFATVQAVVQPPQWSTSDAVSASQPSMY
jgi:hypothetical protein